MLHLVSPSPFGCLRQAQTPSLPRGTHGRSLVSRPPFRRMAKNHIWTSVHFSATLAPTLQTGSTELVEVSVHCCLAIELAGYRLSALGCQPDRSRCADWPTADSRDPAPGITGCRVPATASALNSPGFARSAFRSVLDLPSHSAQAAGEIGEFRPADRVPRRPCNMETLATQVVSTRARQRRRAKLAKTRGLRAFARAMQNSTCRTLGARGRARPIRRQTIQSDSREQSRNECGLDDPLAKAEFGQMLSYRMLGE